MNWLDVVLGLVIGVAAMLEMTRGFGRAVLDALGLYGALYAADALSHPLAASLHVSPHASVNLGIGYGVTLLAFGAFSLAVSRFVYGLTLFHTGMFEGLLGLAAGVAVGVMAAHGVTRVVTMSDPNGGRARVVSDSVLGGEMLSFTTYHSVLNTLSGMTNAHRDLPDVGS